MRSRACIVPHAEFVYLAALVVIEGVCAKTMKTVLTSGQQKVLFWQWLPMAWVAQWQAKRLAVLLSKQYGANWQMIPIVAPKPTTTMMKINWQSFWAML